MLCKDRFAAFNLTRLRLTLVWKLSQIWIYGVLNSPKKRTLGWFPVHKIIPTFAFWENRGHHKFLSRLRQSFWSEKLSSWWCRFNDAWIQRDTSLFSNLVLKINWGHKERHLIFVLKWVYFIVCSILRTYFVSKSVNIAATCIVCPKLFFCKQLSLMVNK